MIGRIRIFFLLSLVTLWFFSPFPLMGEEGEKVDPYDRGPLFLNKMDIKGSVLNPGIPFQIPWKTPESVKAEEEIMVRKNLQNLLVPLDPDDFERAKPSHREGSDNNESENRGFGMTGEE